MMYDWSGDQLWEEGDKQTVIDESMFTGLSTVCVHQKGDLLEGEE